MNKGFFSGVRRNTRSAADQGLNPDDVAFVPAEDDPLSVRPVLFGFKPPHSRYRKTTEPGLQRRYQIDTQLTPPPALYPISTSPNVPDVLSFGNGIWVGASSAIIVTSTDAVTWVTRTSNFGTTAISSVAFGNNLWVAGGVAGQIRTSTDAITWVTQTSNFGTTRINTVAYGNGLWVAGGNSGQIRTSTDAITWVTRTSPHLNAVTALLFGDDRWVAAGRVSIFGDNIVATSTDLVTWVSRTVTSDIFNDANLLATRQGYYLHIQGDNNARLSSDGITWTTVTNGGCGVQPIRPAAANGLTIVPQFSAQIRYSVNGTTYSVATYGTTSWTVSGSDGENIIVINQFGEVLRFTPTLSRGAPSVASSHNEWYVQ